jgi:HPt (histidine-containing phosphotransfer) domain-containing protein
VSEHRLEENDSMKSSTIDQATFDELKESAGSDFVHELVDTFLAEAPGMLADLRRAFTDADAERFRRIAHTLKSNSNTFGALTLGALARNLELGGLPVAGQASAAKLDALGEEYDRVARALTELARG